MRDDSKNASGPAEPLDLSSFRGPSTEAGLSLEQLNAAFAEMLLSGEDPYAEDMAGDSSYQVGGDSSLEPSPAEPAFEVTPRAIIEAMLFVGHTDGAPLTSHEIARHMRGVRAPEIDAWIGELNELYDRRNCPYHIVAEGSGYVLRLRDEHAAARERFYGKARRARLSEAAIEVLAIVAYNQPISASEIHRLRGVPSGHVLAQLVRRELLRLERTSDCPRGRYTTTERLLTLLGLEKVTDLPAPQDMEAPA